jgi:chromosome partitioning protein
MLDQFTHKDLHKIFRMDKARSSILLAENEGRIPKANRIQKGKISVRSWDIKDLPAIGSYYGYLSKPVKKQVLSFYTGKGGVLKTTLAYHFARTLALHGIKTLIIGLDVQESITSLAIEDDIIENISEIPEEVGLYHFLIDREPIDKIIRHTDLPTLDIIPETSDLNLLEKRLRDKAKREYVFAKELIPQLQQYDVIVFDNSPNWNLLIENSITASNNVIAPISCEVGTYQALDKNMKVLMDFKDTLDLHWENYILVPTLLENTKISKQVLGAYITNFGHNLTNSGIRRAVKGQESLILRRSIFEYAPSSELATDYFEVIKEVWDRINKVAQ